MKIRFLSLSLAALAAAACSGGDETVRAADAETPVRDADVAAYRVELLDLAFEGLAAMPADPHLKDRCRAQEEIVVAGALELGLHERALAYIERIEDWRQGAAYADLAYHLAEAGHRSELPTYLERADATATELGDAIVGGWRRDRIRVKVARVYALLGQGEEAEAIAAGATDSEAGKLDVEHARDVTPETFDEHAIALGAALETASFDHKRNLLAACAALYERFADDPERRERVLELMRRSSDRLPLTLRIETLTGLASAALDRGQDAAALGLVDEAQELIDAATWKAEQLLPVVARMVPVRHGLGDTERASGEAFAALARFDEERRTIIDMFRATALVPLAEAFVAIGDLEAAALVYEKALAESVENVNSRPRAIDLARIATSMSVHGFEPDAELRARVDAVRSGLSKPW